MAHMDAPRNWGVSKTGSFGLEAVFRSTLHDRLLRGHSPQVQLYRK